MLVYITARGMYYVPELGENGLFTSLTPARDAVLNSGKIPTYTWDTDTEMQNGDIMDYKVYLHYVKLWLQSTRKGSEQYSYVLSKLVSLL